MEMEIQQVMTVMGIMELEDTCQILHIATGWHKVSYYEKRNAHFHCPGYTPLILDSTPRRVVGLRRRGVA